MSKRGIAVLVCALLGTSAIAGCGGSDDESLTKAEFVRQADAICKKADAKRDTEVKAAIEKQQESKRSMTNAEGEDLIVDVALPPLDEMTAELADLGEPEPEGEKATAMVSAFEDGLEVIEDDTAKVLQGSVDPFKSAKKLAVDYGVKACSEV